VPQERLVLRRLGPQQDRDEGAPAVTAAGEEPLEGDDEVERDVRLDVVVRLAPALEGRKADGSIFSKVVPASGA
jgi:hypothetical protein